MGYDSGRSVAGGDDKEIICHRKFVRLAIDIRKKSDRSRAPSRRFFPVERAHGESRSMDHPVHGKTDQVLDIWKISKSTTMIFLRIPHSFKYIEEGDDD